MDEVNYDALNESDSEIPLANTSHTKQYKVYKWRWFLLATLSILNISNAMIWLTFGPIAYKAASFYSTTTDSINWLSIVFMITGVPCGIIATWLIDTVGLRFSVIMSAWLNCIGAVIRVISAIDGISPSAALPLVFVGQIIAAFAQPFIVFAPTKLASLWFREDQRAIANMIATTANPIGMMFSNILSPLLLPNSSDMLFMLAIQCIPAGLALLMATFGWWSTRPKTPPSGSSETDSEPFIIGLKALLKNKQYWILVVCVGAGVALFSVLTTLMSQILCPWGYTDTFVGVVCVSVIIGSGVIGAGIAGVIVDRNHRFMEVTKIGLGVAVLALVAFSVLQNHSGQWAAIVCVGAVFGFFGIPVYPIGNELAVETTYPVGEATSSGIVFMFGQIQGILLVLILQSIGTPLPPDQQKLSQCDSSITVTDMSVPAYVMAGYATFIAIIYILFFKTEYKRLNAERLVQEGRDNVEEE